MSQIKRWYDAPAPVPKAHHSEKGSVVESFAQHVNAAHAAALEQLQIYFSQAGAKAMQWIKEHLVVHFGDDPSGTTERQRLLAADLQLNEICGDNLPNWVQELIDSKPGPVLPAKPARAIRIAWGEIAGKQKWNTVLITSWIETKGFVEIKQDREWQSKHLDPRRVLQQLFVVLTPARQFKDMLGVCFAGVGQEVAQQLTSHLMLADSGTVAQAVFPTIEDRDPVTRRRDWEAALKNVCLRVTPFPYQTARELNPGAYAQDDPRGTRLVNVDPLWQQVLASPEAQFLPLLYVSGKAIGLYRWIRPSTRHPKRKGKSAGVARTGRTTLVALPISKQFIASLPDTIQKDVAWWRRAEVCGHLSPLTPFSPPLTKKKTVLLIPLSYGRRRSEQHVFPALQRLPLQWGRVVRRLVRKARKQSQRWSFQGTIGYGIPVVSPRRTIGIHFGLDNVYWWALVEEHEENIRRLDQGCITGNPILAHSLAKKKELEWDQQKMRWVGGAVYAQALAADAHKVVDGLLNLALLQSTPESPVGLCVESIRWVDKHSGSAEANRRFSNWDFGQLRRIITYKAGAAGIPCTAIWPSKTDRTKSDTEQAWRFAAEGQRRFRQRRLRQEEKEEE